ncbi:MAG: SDR family NAD(P)-dependent oxidoreductase, partial [Pseudomonadota bacterium]|nr:SDR family NAD(P)-dependent oxidoreductase [Pseudomonadota bacterium]
MQLDKKVVAITGGARGLGFAIAKRLGKRGAQIALVDMSAEALDGAVSALGSEGVSAHAFVANVADEQSVQHAFADIGQRLGPVSGCVNNAGITDDG